jgi:hypothetical protein
MGLFDQPIAYLIRPDGGIDIGRLYSQGIRVFLLCMQDTDGIDDGAIIVDGRKFPTWSFEAWATPRKDGTEAVTRQIEKYPGAVWLPWADVRTDADCWKLRRLGLEAYAAQRSRLSFPAACWDAEKAIETTISLPEMIRSAESFDVLWSTTPWAFSSVQYELCPSHWIIDVQLFPHENDSSHRPRDCRAQFYAEGFKGRVHFQHCVNGGIRPEELPFPELGRTSLYPGDDLRSDLFKPRTLQPVEPWKFPYLGPFYSDGPLVSRIIWTNDRRENIRQIKKALHNAGYGNFPNPDGAYNKACAQAMARMQRDKGISATGQYGKLSYEALRRLASAVPGQSWALPS